MRILILVILCVACGTPSTAPPSARPEGRWLQGMVYDAAHARVLVFGGRTHVAGSDVYLNDLWSWDGRAWNRLPTLVAPPGRDEMILTYDDARQTLVLFGGHNESGLLGDTWEWDGTTWTQKATAGPPPRKHSGGGYDRARQRTVLYGGLSASDSALTDTWEWDGASWTLKANTRPFGFAAPTNPMFDAGRNALIMFIGTFSHAYPTELWQWNGTAWTVIESGPTMVLPTPLAVDGSSNVVLYSTDFAFSMTWKCNVLRWASIDGLSPSLRLGASMVYDAAHDRMLLFGGSSGSTLFNELWAFSGSAWTLVS